MSPMRDKQQTTSKDRATQLLICEPLTFATQSLPLLTGLALSAEGPFDLMSRIVGSSEVFLSLLFCVLQSWEVLVSPVAVIMSSS